MSCIPKLDLLNWITLFILHCSVPLTCNNVSPAHCPAMTFQKVICESVILDNYIICITINN